MSETSSDRDAVVSAANVLMVALLKLNRVIIPAALKWTRGRRMAWIQSAERDLEEQERRDLNGPRPRRRYQLGRMRNSTRADQVKPQDPEDKLDIQSEHARNTSTSSSPPDAIAHGINPANGQEQGVESSAEQKREKINKLQKLRAEKMDLFVYKSVMTVAITVLSIFLYSMIIISLVLSLFPFTKSQSLVFSFSLIATATVSEADFLLGARRDNGDQKNKDPANFRIKPGATGASMNDDPSGMGEEGQGGVYGDNELYYEGVGQGGNGQMGGGGFDQGNVEAGRSRRWSSEALYADGQGTKVDVGEGEEGIKVNASGSGNVGMKGRSGTSSSGMAQRGMGVSGSIQEYGVGGRSVVVPRLRLNGVGHSSDSLDFFDDML